MLLLNLRYVLWCRDPFLSRQCQYPPQCHHQRPTGSPCHQHRCLLKGVWVVPLCLFWIYTCDLSWPIPVPVHRCVIFECQGTLKHTTHRDGEGPQEPYWIFQHSFCLIGTVERGLDLKKNTFQNGSGQNGSLLYSSMLNSWMILVAKLLGEATNKHVVFSMVSYLVTCLQLSFPTITCYMWHCKSLAPGLSSCSNPEWGQCHKTTKWSQTPTWPQKNK